MHINRPLALILLSVVAAGMLLYGSFFHRIGVEVEKQREISIAVPNRSAMMERGWGRQGPGGDPMQNASGPPVPDMKMETVTESYIESQSESEWTIVRETTIGGVARLANGLLKRTYSGKPPALCPT
jgi:hypothetical protein